MANLETVGSMNRAVLLDRDGTIIRDAHYCSRVEDVELLPKAGEGLKLLSDCGFRLLVITNQSGLARGFFNEDTLGRIHQTMRVKLAAFGARLDAIYYCPHHPNDMCDCRKPNPKLVYQATKDWEIDLNESFVIGYRLTDIQMAKAVGCKAVMIESEYTENDLKGSSVVPDCIMPDIESAARWIISQNRLLWK